MKFARLVLVSVFSPRLQEKSDRRKMVLIAVEAVPVGNRPPATVSLRISTGERHGFGASAPLSIRTSSLQGRAGGSAVMLKLDELVGPASILFAEQLSPCFA